MDGLRYSGIPLGGLGTGSVELRADGFFHDWQIMNNRPWGAGPAVELQPDASFFNLQVLAPGINRCATLGLLTQFRYNGYVNNPYLAPSVEWADEIRADLRAPCVSLQYGLRDFPVEARLDAFSPLIPLNARDSALPLAFFTFTLRNRTARTLRVSLVHALRNLVGYDLPESDSVMSFARRGDVAFIRLGREALPDSHMSDGTLVSAVFSPSPGPATYVLHPRRVNDLYLPLSEKGMLDNRDWVVAQHRPGEEVAERLRKGMPLGILSRTVTLKPRAEPEVTFIFAWHFPNMHDLEYSAKNCPPTCLGHQYANWFGDAVEVALYGRREFARLRAQTLAFRDAFYRSSHPRWVLDAVNAQLTTLAKSSWWDRRGRFGIWEGLSRCGLQTTDITYYGSFPIVLFFPEIQKSQMRLTTSRIEEKGKIPHLMPGNFSCCDLDLPGRIDLVPQFILLVWRDLLWTGDRKYAAEMWPFVNDALRYAERFDTDGDGLPNNTRWDQTYDEFPVKDTSAFCGFLWAAGLKAAGELAGALGHDEEADELGRRCTEAVAELERQLWNGRYYRLCHTRSGGANNEGVLVDQINGDWFVRQTTGAGLLPEARVRSALSAVLEHCRRPGFLANCSWPKGKEQPINRQAAAQARTPWSGTEYAFSAFLILAGMEKEALKVARDVWDRYEAHGLRFDHVECGEHYYRAMSSWAIYLALNGFALDRRRGELTLRVRRRQSAFVLNTPAAWGEAITRPKGKVLEFTLRAGRDTLRSLLLRGVKADRLTLRRNGRKLECGIAPAAGGVRIRFAGPLRLVQGDVLTVTA